MAHEFPDPIYPYRILREVLDGEIISTEEGYVTLTNKLKNKFWVTRSNPEMAFMLCVDPIESFQLNHILQVCEQSEVKVFLTTKTLMENRLTVKSVGSGSVLVTLKIRN